MKRLAISAAVILAASCSVAHAPSSRGFDPGKVRAAATKAPRPFDQPEAAEQYARAKRLGGSSIDDPRAAWDRAVARREAMPAHALARERREDPEVAATAAALAARWESLGPGNIGGRTRGLLVHPENHAILYAAGVSGGVFKSVDDGGSWNPVGDVLANIAVNSLAMDPLDPQTLYAGTGEGYFREEVRGTWLPLRGGGIFATADGGATWARLASTEGADFH